MSNKYKLILLSVIFIILFSMFVFAPDDNYCAIDSDEVKDYNCCNESLISSHINCSYSVIYCGIDDFLYLSNPEYANAEIENGEAEKILVSHCNEVPSYINIGNDFCNGSYIHNTYNCSYSECEINGTFKNTVDCYCGGTLIKNQYCCFNSTGYYNSSTPFPDTANCGSYLVHPQGGPYDISGNITFTSSDVINYSQLKQGLSGISPTDYSSFEIDSDGNLSLTNVYGSHNIYFSIRAFNNVDLCLNCTSNNFNIDNTTTTYLEFNVSCNNIASSFCDGGGSGGSGTQNCNSTEDLGDCDYINNSICKYTSDYYWHEYDLSNTTQRTEYCHECSDDEQCDGTSCNGVCDPDATNDPDCPGLKCDFSGNRWCNTSLGNWMNFPADLNSTEYCDLCSSDSDCDIYCNVVNQCKYPTNSICNGSEWIYYDLTIPSNYTYYCSKCSGDGDCSAVSCDQTCNGVCDSSCSLHGLYDPDCPGQECDISLHKWCNTTLGDWMNSSHLGIPTYCSLCSADSICTSYVTQCGDVYVNSSYGEDCDYGNPWNPSTGSGCTDFSYCVPPSAGVGATACTCDPPAVCDNGLIENGEHCENYSGTWSGCSASQTCNPTTCQCDPISGSCDYTADSAIDNIYLSIVPCTSNISISITFNSICLDNVSSIALYESNSSGGDKTYIDHSNVVSSSVDFNVNYSTNLNNTKKYYKFKVTFDDFSVEWYSLIKEITLGDYYCMNWWNDKFNYDCVNTHCYNNDKTNCSVINKLNSDPCGDNFCVYKATGVECLSLVNASTCTRCGGTSSMFYYPYNNRKFDLNGDNNIVVDAGDIDCNFYFLYSPFKPANCYTDLEYSSIDSVKACADVSSCYDYKSKQKCEEDPCLRTNKSCVWNEYNSQTGRGVCAPEQESLMNCSKALKIDYNNIFLYKEDSNYLTSQRICDLYGECYFNGFSCLDQGLLICSNFVDEKDCIGNIGTEFSIDNNTLIGSYFSDNLISNKSKCKWDASKTECYRDADDNGWKDDPNLYLKFNFFTYMVVKKNNIGAQRDFTSPETNISFSDWPDDNTFGSIQNIYFELSDNYYDTSEIYTYYCLDSGAHVNPSVESNVYNANVSGTNCNLETHFDNWTEISSMPLNLDLSQDNYTLYFFSVDNSLNIEQIKAINFSILKTAPNITVSYSYYPLGSGTNNLKINFSVDAYNNEPAKCTAWLENSMTRENITIPGLTTTPGHLFNQTIKKASLSYYDIADGNYLFHVDCLDLTLNTHANKQEPIILQGDMRIFGPNPFFNVTKTNKLNISIKTINNATCYYMRGNATSVANYEDIFSCVKDSSYIPKYDPNVCGQFDYLNSNRSYHIKELNLPQESGVYIYDVACSIDTYDPAIGNYISEMVNGSSADKIIFAQDYEEPNIYLYTKYGEVEADYSLHDDVNFWYNKPTLVNLSCVDAKYFNDGTDNISFYVGSNLLNFGCENEIKYNYSDFGICIPAYPLSVSIIPNNNEFLLTDPDLDDGVNDGGTIFTFFYNASDKGGNSLDSYIKNTLRLDDTDPGFNFNITKSGIIVSTIGEGSHEILLNADENLSSTISYNILNFTVIGSSSSSGPFNLSLTMLTLNNLTSSLDTNSMYGGSYPLKKDEGDVEFHIIIEDLHGNINDTIISYPFNTVLPSTLSFEPMLEDTLTFVDRKGNKYPMVYHVNNPQIGNLYYNTTPGILDDVYYTNKSNLFLTGFTDANKDPVKLSFLVKEKDSFDDYEIIDNYNQDYNGINLSDSFSYSILNEPGVNEEGNTRIILDSVYRDVCDNCYVAVVHKQDGVEFDESQNRISTYGNYSKFYKITSVKDVIIAYVDYTALILSVPLEDDLNKIEQITIYINSGLQDNRVNNYFDFIFNKTYRSDSSNIYEVRIKAETYGGISQVYDPKNLFIDTETPTIRSPDLGSLGTINYNNLTVNFTISESYYGSGIDVDYTKVNIINATSGIQIRYLNFWGYLNISKNVNTVDYNFFYNSSSTDYESFDNGNYTIQIKTKDYANNFIEENYNFVVDAEAPSAPLVNVTNSLSEYNPFNYNDSFSVFAVNESVANISLKFIEEVLINITLFNSSNDNIWECNNDCIDYTSDNISFNIDVNGLDEGFYYIDILAFKTADNTHEHPGHWNSTGIFVDTTVPDFTMTVPDVLYPGQAKFLNVTVINQELDVMYNVSDNDSSYYIDFDNFWDDAYLNGTLLGWIVEGNYSFNLTVYDHVMNSATLEGWTIFNPVPPLLEDFKVYPASSTPADNVSVLFNNDYKVLVCTNEDLYNINYQNLEVITDINGYINEHNLSINFTNSSHKCFKTNVSYNPVSDWQLGDFSDNITFNITLTDMYNNSITYSKDILVNTLNPDLPSLEPVGFGENSLIVYSDRDDESYPIRYHSNNSDADINDVYFGYDLDKVYYINKENYPITGFVDSQLLEIELYSSHNCSDSSSKIDTFEISDYNSYSFAVVNWVIFDDVSYNNKGSNKVYLKTNYTRCDDYDGMYLELAYNSSCTQQSSEAGNRRSKYGSYSSLYKITSCSSENIIGTARAVLNLDADLECGLDKTRSITNIYDSKYEDKYFDIVFNEDYGSNSDNYYCVRIKVTSENGQSVNSNPIKLFIDNSALTIHDFKPGTDTTINYLYPNISFIVKEDQYGSGFYKDGSFIYIYNDTNDDLLSTIISPGFNVDKLSVESNKLRYNVSFNPNLGNGEYRFVLIMSDYAGNMRNNTYKFEIDNMAPSAPLVNVTNSLSKYNPFIYNSLGSSGLSVFAVNDSVANISLEFVEEVNISVELVDVAYSTSQDVSDKCLSLDNKTFNCNLDNTNLDVNELYIINITAFRISDLDHLHPGNFYNNLLSVDTNSPNYNDLDLPQSIVKGEIKDLGINVTNEIAVFFNISSGSNYYIDEQEQFNYGDTMYNPILNTTALGWTTNTEELKHYNITIYDYALNKKERVNNAIVFNPDPPIITNFSVLRGGNVVDEIIGKSHTIKISADEPLGFHSNQHLYLSEGNNFNPDNYINLSIEHYSGNPDNITSSISPTSDDIINLIGVNVKKNVTFRVVLEDRFGNTGSADYVYLINTELPGEPVLEPLLNLDPGSFTYGPEIFYDRSGVEYPVRFYKYNEFAKSGFRDLLNNTYYTNKIDLKITGFNQHINELLDLELRHSYLENNTANYDFFLRDGYSQSDYDGVNSSDYLYSFNTSSDPIYNKKGATNIYLKTKATALSSGNYLIKVPYNTELSGANIILGKSNNKQSAYNHYSQYHHVTNVDNFGTVTILTIDRALEDYLEINSAIEFYSYKDHAYNDDYFELLNDFTEYYTTCDNEKNAYVLKITATASNEQSVDLNTIKVFYDSTNPTYNYYGPQGTYTKLHPDIILNITEDSCGSGVDLSNSDIYIYNDTNDVLYRSLQIDDYNYTIDMSSGNIIYSINYSDGVTGYSEFVNGEYRIEFDFFDYAGNKINDNVIYFTIDTQAPSIPLINVTNSPSTYNPYNKDSQEIFAIKDSQANISLEFEDEVNISVNLINETGDTYAVTCDTYSGYEFDCNSVGDLEEGKYVINVSAWKTNDTFKDHVGEWNNTYVLVDQTTPEFNLSHKKYMNINDQTQLNIDLFEDEDNIIFNVSSQELYYLDENPVLHNSTNLNGTFFGWNTEGNYSFNLTVMDYAGNYHKKQSSILVDATPPDLEIINVSADPLINFSQLNLTTSDVNITIEGETSEDIDHVCMDINTTDVGNNNLISQEDECQYKCSDPRYTTGGCINDTIFKFTFFVDPNAVSVYSTEEMFLQYIDLVATDVAQNINSTNLSILLDWQSPSMINVTIE